LVPLHTAELSTLFAMSALVHGQSLTGIVNFESEQESLINDFQTSQGKGDKKARTWKE
jgi:hypothetical protein